MKNMNRQKSMNSFDPENNYPDLYRLIAHTRAALHKSIKTQMSRTGVLPKQAEALFALKSIGHEATVQELAEYVFRENHSTAELINRMEKNGLVTYKGGGGFPKIYFPSQLIEDNIDQFEKIVNQIDFQQQKKKGK